MKKNYVMWGIALAMTLAMAIYQRLSGPTRPLRGSERIGDARIAYKFHRSWTSHRALPVRVSGEGLASMRLHYRRYPLIEGDSWSCVPMTTRAGAFEAHVPGPPAAGKVAYKIEAQTAERSVFLNNGLPVVARFKNRVPIGLLMLHIIAMFAGLLLAFRAGIGALLCDEEWRRLVPFVFGLVVVGGLLLGPLVQKYAFGSFWTGFPLGRDLTDTKTLFVALIWLAALLRRKRSRWWTVAATALMIAVYLIPHSLFGSELDYKTGKIETAGTIGD